MVNKKMLILTLIILCLLSISAISAAENITSDVVSNDTDDCLSVSYSISDDYGSSFVNSKIDNSSDKIYAVSNNDKLSEDIKVYGDSDLFYVIDGDENNIYFKFKTDGEILVIPKQSDGYFYNDYAEFFSLPKSFTIGDNLYSLHQNERYCLDWYYTVHTIDSNSVYYILEIDACHDEDGVIRGETGDYLTVHANVYCSNNNQRVYGCIVFDDLASKSDPIYVNENGYVIYEYRLKYTGTNGGFLNAYFYEGSYSSSNKKAESLLKYYTTQTEYVIDTGYNESKVYVSWGQQAIFNIKIYNKYYPSKEVSGIIDMGYPSSDGYPNWNQRHQQIIWDPIEKVGKVKFVVSNVEQRVGYFTKEVAFRLYPGTTIRCDDVYHTVCFLYPITFSAQVTRNGSYIYVDYNTISAVNQGNVVVEIPSVNKTFKCNVTNGRASFSFLQEDYFPNKLTNISISYRDSGHFYSSASLNYSFMDDLYLAYEDMEITNIYYGYYDKLAPDVHIVMNSNYSVNKFGFVILYIDGFKYTSSVVNSNANFLIQHFLNVGEHQVMFEYYYDGLHECLGSKNVTISISNETHVDFIVTNEWIHRDKLEPVIKVVDKFTNTSYEGILARYITTSNVYQYINGQPVYERILEEHELINGTAKFNEIQTPDSYLIEDFYFYFSNQNINYGIVKSVKFESKKPNVELIGPTSLNLTIGNNITFNISIKDFDKLLDIFPEMKKFDSYPFIECIHVMGDKVEYDASYRNKGIFTFTLHSKSWSDIIKFEVYNYVAGSLEIPCNVSRINPIFKISNNGVINASNKIGISLEYGFGSMIHLYEKEYGELKCIGHENGVYYYEIPFKTGIKTIHFKYEPDYEGNSRNPYNPYEIDYILNMMEGTLKVKTYIVVNNVTVDKGGNYLEATLKDSAGNTISNANVVVNIDDVSYAVKTDSKGIIKLYINGLVQGTHVAEISYDGNEEYNSGSTTTEINVEKTNTIINAVFNAVDNTVVATLTNDVTGAPIKGAYVKFYVNGQLTSVKTDDNGRAKLSVSDLAPATYTVTVSYNGGTKYDPSQTTEKIIVRLITSLSAVYNSNTNQIIATLTNNDTGQVIGGGRINFNIDGENYTATTNSRGQAKISTKDLTIGTYTANAEYKGNSKYAPSNISTTFTVKISTTISAVYNVGNKELVATLINDVTDQHILGATVTFKINNVSYKVRTDNSGQAKLSVADLPLGTYDAVVSYGGNTKYNPSSFNVNVPIKADTRFDLVYNANDKELVATLFNNASGQVIKGATVSVVLNNVGSNLKTDTNGQVKVSTKDLASGVYPAAVSYGGNAKYNSTQTTLDVIIDVKTSVAAVYKDGILTATLTDEATGKGINGAILLVDFGGVEYEVKTDSNGQANVSTKDLAPGEYTASVYYNGAGNTSSSTSIPINVKVYAYFIVEDVTADFNTNVDLVATLINYATGNGIVGATVGFKINGKSYSAKTDANGQAKVSIPGLNPGTYATIVSYNGNTKYDPAKETFDVVVNKITTSIAVYYDSQTNEVVATLINKITGDVVKGGTIGIFLNNVKHIIVTDMSGQVRLSLGDVDPTSFTAYVTYAGNAKYLASSRTLTPVENKVESYISTVYNKETAEVVATLINKATDKGVVGGTVSIVVNNVRNDIKTDTNGQAKVSIADLAPNVYKVVCSYAGNTKYTATTETIYITKT